MTPRTRIAILGSTGSIGRSALSVVEAHPDRLEVIGLAAGANAALLATQITHVKPRIAAMASAHAIDTVRGHLGSHVPPALLAGAEGLLAVATHPDVEILLCA